MNKIDNLLSEISETREQLLKHKLYNKLNSVEAISKFMEIHVFAVWDFMSLAKSLQKNLTCVEIPWYPTEDKVSRRLINEIILGEESDVDQKNNPASHFELYVESMKKIGSSTNLIEKFVRKIKETKDYNLSMEWIKPPTNHILLQIFLDFTFDTINTLNKSHVIASVFTFGREDLIPDMFINIVKTLNEKNETQISDLLYYLERHIELDGDEHGPMALKMISELCGDDATKWEEAFIEFSTNVKESFRDEN